MINDGPHMNAMLHDENSVPTNRNHRAAEAELPTLQLPKTIRTRTC
jgi:hypothetical protein